MIHHAERRVFLEEIAYLRAERGRYRLMAGEEALPYSAQLKARLRADGCNRAIRSLRNVWDGLEGVARQAAEDALAVEADDRLYIGPIQHDFALCKPGQCPGTRGCWCAACERGTHARLADAADDRSIILECDGMPA
jgi:hypothetical protein